MRPDATDGERLAVARLVGRAVPAGRSTSLSLERLEEMLRSSGAWPAGLASAVVALTGPVADPRVREEEQRAWASVTAELMALADLRPELTEWLEGLRARGQLRRVAGSAVEASALIAQLRAVVAALPAEGESIARFSARVLDRAHALDAGTALGGLAAAAAEVLGRHAADGVSTTAARPGSAAWRRDVWAAVGAVVDDLSSTVLALGLPGSLANPGLAGALAQFAVQGQPVVLTLRQLTADDVGPVPGVVFVCENPAVVAAAADALGSASPPLVCLQGQPSAAAVVLLRHLAAHGAAMRYHGDFDWGGVAIAKTLASHVGWRPWRYDADAYVAAIRLRGDALPTLTGAPQATPWEPRLAEAMKEQGVNVEEEVVIDALIGDLGDWS
ncbi:MAG: TIGR02679 family protein [Trueperaceae bacterium]|nr:TIGR02679 family protein [Trueperaceae bacterium]